MSSNLSVKKNGNKLYHTELKKQFLSPWGWEGGEESGGEGGEKEDGEEEDEEDEEKEEAETEAEEAKFSWVG